MRNYRNYDVWEKAHKLVWFVYREILTCFSAGARRNLMEYASLPTQDLGYINKEKHQHSGSIIDEVKAIHKQ